MDDQYDEDSMDSCQSIKEILQYTIGDMFKRTRAEGRAASIEAMNRELPKICAMLDLDPVTLEPIDQSQRGAHE
jgi:hypothetical protein